MSRNKRGAKSQGKQSQQYSGCNRSERRDSQSKKVTRGEELCREEQRTKREEFNLGWYIPNEEQKDIVYSMTEDSLTLVASKCTSNLDSAVDGRKPIKSSLDSTGVLTNIILSYKPAL